MKKLIIPIEVLQCEVCGYRASHVMQMDIDIMFKITSIGRSYKGV